MRQYALVRASFLNRGTSRPCSKGCANVFQSRHQQSKRQHMERAESPEVSPLPTAEPGEAAKLWGAEPGAAAKLWGAAPALRSISAGAACSWGALLHPRAVSLPRLKVLLL